MGGGADVAEPWPVTAHPIQVKNVFRCAQACAQIQKRGCVVTAQATPLSGRALTRLQQCARFADCRIAKQASRNRRRRRASQSNRATIREDACVAGYQCRSYCMPDSRLSHTHTHQSAASHTWTDVFFLEKKSSLPDRSENKAARPRPFLHPPPLSRCLPRCLPDFCPPIPSPSPPPWPWYARKPGPQS